MNKPQNLQTDVIVVGAGPVGISTALHLSNKGLHCILIEKNCIQAKRPTKSNSFDGRTLALNLRSIKFLQAINCLPSAQHLQPIEKIRVSQRGSFGSCLLESDREHLSQFGTTVNSIDLGETMHETILKQDSVQFMDEVEILDLENKETDNGIVLKIKRAQTSYIINSKILIAADGTESTVRQHCNLPTTRKNYHQFALLTKVSHEKPHHNIAHERFLKNGVLAALPTHLGTRPETRRNPISNDRGYVSSLVWLQRQDQFNSTENMSASDLLSTLQKLFGWQYGKFTELNGRVTHPMQEVLASKTHFRNIILIGNAAHSFHPIAGQGLNLGLWDTKNLVNHIERLGCTAQALETFATQQRKIVQETRDFVNDLLDRFDTSDRLTTIGRNILMLGFEKLTPFRRPFLHYMSGVREQPPWFWRYNKKSHELGS